jgi:FkbM family methyltransferase
MANDLLSKATNGVFGGLITALAKACPGGARRAFPAYVDSIGTYDALSQVLSRTAIESISVEGVQGNYAGAATDVSVIQRYAIEGRWSLDLIERALAHFKAHGAGTFFDVGANIGLTTVPIAKGGAKVVSFEPVPGNFAFLSRNVAHNGVSGRVSLNNVALMEAPGELVFELNPSNHGDHRARRGSKLALASEDVWETVTVQGRMLNDYADAIEGPLVLKIDVQGAEPLVIAGGRAVCDRAELVFLEFTPYSMCRMETDPQVVIDYIASFKNILIFEREEEENARTMDQKDVASYLRDYYERNKHELYGRYVNLILSR